VTLAPAGEEKQPEPVVAAPVVEKKPEVVVEAPVDIWPSIVGGEVIRGVPPRREPTPASQPSEWSAPPAADAAEWNALPAAPAPAPAPAARLNEEEPAPAVTVTKKSPAKDLEAIFMSRAEESVTAGTCDRFLLGLEEIAQDAQRTARTEQARVLRARCFDTQMRPRQAMSEYRKYLEEYPRGQFATEAHTALGE